MDGRDAFRWTLVYRGIWLVSVVVGAGLVGLGLVVGFDLSAFLAEPTEPTAATNPAVTGALTLAGLAVWLFGRSFALYVTLPRAAGEAAAEAFDTERVRSEVLEVLDDRLAAIEDEIETTRRGVQELKRTEHAETFDEEALDPDRESTRLAIDDTGSDPTPIETADPTPLEAGGSTGERTEPTPLEGETEPTPEGRGSTRDERGSTPDGRAGTASGGTDDATARAEPGDAQGSNDAFDWNETDAESTESSNR